MFAVSLLMAVLQIGVINTPPPITRYQWVTTPESNAPVALCDAQFSCHCPVGYKAVMQQGAVSTESVSVLCEPKGGNAQPRETYDSYPILPQHENVGK